MTTITVAISRMCSGHKLTGSGLPNSFYMRASTTKVPQATVRGQHTALLVVSGVLETFCRLHWLACYMDYWMVVPWKLASALNFHCLRSSVWLSSLVAIVAIHSPGPVPCFEHFCCPDVLGGLYGSYCLAGPRLNWPFTDVFLPMWEGVWQSWFVTHPHQSPIQGQEDLSQTRVWAPSFLEAWKGS